jgi:hypothetical protein
LVIGWLYKRDKGSREQQQQQLLRELSAATHENTQTQLKIGEMTQKFGSKSIEAQEAEKKHLEARAALNRATQKWDEHVKLFGRLVASK